MMINSAQDYPFLVKEVRRQLGLSQEDLAHKLGVSLKTNNRLQTFNRNNPINFWNYEPQGDYDKAPVKFV